MTNAELLNAAQSLGILQIVHVGETKPAQEDVTTEFTYTNRGPSPWNTVRSNLIRLRREGRKVIFDRFYITKDGNPVEDPISSEFEGDEVNAKNIARNIHWGCCGWDDRGTTDLLRKVELFLSGEPKKTPPVLRSRRFGKVIGNELHVRKYEDPGHGWLAVPVDWLEALGIRDKVSRCSFVRGGTAYLEEDCDAPLFMTAAKSAGYSCFIDFRHTDGRSSIRSYESF
jgi:hypothetical protein